MKHRPLRQAVRIVCAIVAAMVCEQFVEGPVHAQALDGNQVVIRYLNDPGAVRSFEIAEALGFLKDKGIRIESKGDSHGGPETLAALLSGSIDAGGIATPAVINAAADGAKILCVMPALGINKDINSKLFVLDGSSIKAPADLKNKSIAVNAMGAHLDYSIREYLRMHGLNRDDVKLVKVAGPMLDQTLRGRQTDVVAVGAWQGPVAKAIAVEGGVRVLFTDYDVLGDLVLGNIVMNKSFIDQHPEIVREFVTASAKAADWASAHPDEARKMLAEILKKRGDDPAAATAWSGYGLPQHALYEDHDMKFWLDVLVREGKVKPGQLDPEDIATNKYNAYAGISRH
jgi:ABC-type nitrate/sulfonate/bicarbonate transport system substrate-binding protein